MTSYTYIDTSLGRLLLLSENDQLTGLYFTDSKHVPEIESDWRKKPQAEIFKLVEKQITEFSTGKRRTFELPLVLNGTSFQQKVWKNISKIPFGKTITYSELAKKSGKPAAIRAASTATGKNPIAWIIPCHRIIGKSGALTGYTGGLKRKSALLNFESSVNQHLS